MAFGTLSVAAATTPTVISAFFKHLLHQRSLRRDQRPEAEVSYDEGIQIVRSFLKFSSRHTVEELQAFTKAKVPVPGWVERKHVQLRDQHSDKAAAVLRDELEELDSVDAVGGLKWWTWRAEPLLCEWVEMRKSRLQREHQEALDKEQGKEPEPLRVLLYIHGGAHHFSSLDTHRYQVQRHARKFGAKAFSVSYRLAPQFPFPCQLHDALAAWFYLVDECQLHPSQIIVSGDSAGGGTALALACVLRDQRLPLPAGTCLLSPWLDLTHSFPSIHSEEGERHDYVPAHGFHYKPSLSWPPAPSDPVEIQVNGKPKKLDEQIQMLTSNRMLDHPLVTLVNQGSLGGLTPICFLHGNSELLRDEQMYAAHKAAHPAAYPPSDQVLDKYPVQRAKLAQYPPTKVHLFTFDGSCHVLPTLAFATPAKFMYRAAASFNLWAVKLGAKTTEARQRLKKMPSNISTSGVRHKIENDMLSDLGHDENMPDDLSIGSEASSISDMEDEGEMTLDRMVTVTGAPPRFKNSMARERVSTSGRRRPMEAEADIPCLNLDRNSIGILKDGPPIQRFLQKRTQMDEKYSRLHKKFREQKLTEWDRAAATGFLTKNMQGERPPRSSIVTWADPNLAMRCAGPQSSYNKKERMANAVWARLSAMPDAAEAGAGQIDQMSAKLADTKLPGAERTAKKLSGSSQYVKQAATGPDGHRAVGKDASP